jgi:hypothetical protein
LGGLATAPVLTAFVEGGTGLAVPDRRLATQDDPPPPLLISSLTPPSPDMRAGQPMKAPDGQLLVWIDGQPWRLLAWRA